MVPGPCVSTAPVPPPAYQRVVAKRGPVLHIDALTLVTRLHLLTLCGLAVRQAPRRCQPLLPKGPGGAPRRYSDASLLLIALLPRGPRDAVVASQRRHARLVISRRRRRGE